MTHNYYVNSELIKAVPLLFEHIELLREIRNDDRFRFRFNNTEIISAEQQKNWYEKYCQKPDDYIFALEEIAIARVIGFCSVFNILPYKKGEFGRLMIHPDVQGKGYGTTAVNLMKEFALNKLKLEELHLSVLKNNIIAQKLYEKCGFVKTDEDEKVIFMKCIL